MSPWLTISSCFHLTAEHQECLAACVQLQTLTGLSPCLHSPAANECLQLCKGSEGPVVLQDFLQLTQPAHLFPMEQI